MDYHIPVMPKETVDALAIRPSGIYVDCTLGSGGHSGIILKKLNKNGRLIGIDQDIDAIKEATKRLEIEAVHDTFHNFTQIMNDKNIAHVDGVLIDLGVSSHQLDTAERGFSYRLSGALDMRMNQESDTKTAADIVNTYSEEQLVDILFSFGEERFSRRIAKAIVTERVDNPIVTTQHLSDIIKKATPYQKPGMSHPAMRSFMALRIAVNNELNPLDEVLTQIIDHLSIGGRICVLTFHSLEDRIVKKCFNRLVSPCICPREIPYCVCNKLPQLRVITKKPILPSQDELKYNNRAHSAKLRVGEKIDANWATPSKTGTKDKTIFKKTTKSIKP